MSAGFDIDVIAALTDAGMRPERIGTGGGCTALQVPVPESGGWFLLVTDDEGFVPTEAGEPILVGLYEPGGTDCCAEDSFVADDLAELVPGIRALLTGAMTRAAVR